MKYELIAIGGDKNDLTFDTKHNIALILRGEKIKFAEYAVVRNLDLDKPEENNEQWDFTIEYYQNDVYGLQKAIECFRTKTEENYIPRMRLEELATQFKDGLVEAYGDDPETSEVIEDLIETYELADYEAEFFGLKESED